MIWHTCPCCGVERRPHHEECDVPDACPEEEADWAEMSDLRAEIARLRLTDAEREALESAERCLLWQSAVEAEGEIRDDRPPHKSIERAQDAATLRTLLARLGGAS